MSNVLPFQRRVADPRDPEAMTYGELVEEANALIEIADSETGATPAENARCVALLDQLEVLRNQ